MNLPPQMTLTSEFALQGIGLHTGNRSKIVFRPAPANAGLRFHRTDLPGSPMVPATRARMMSSMLTSPKNRPFSSTGTPLIFFCRISSWASRMVAERLTVASFDVMTSRTFRRWISSSRTSGSLSAAGSESAFAAEAADV